MGEQESAKGEHCIVCLSHRPQMTGQPAVDQDDGEYTHHIDAAVSGDGNDGLEGSEIDTCRRQGAMVSKAYPGYKMRLSLPQTEGGRQV